jgi:hypothetical protein
MLVYRVDKPGIMFRFLIVKNDFLSTASRLVLGPIAPPIQSEPEVLFPGLRSESLTNHLHVVSKFRMHGAMPPFCHIYMHGVVFNTHRDNFTFSFPE